MGSQPQPNTLKPVLSPFARSLRAGSDLNSKLKSAPEEGHQELAKLADETRKDIAGLDGFDGFCYLLIGAEPEYCSPMQYGGYYLELDRELLTAAEPGKLSMLLAVGGEEVFIDALSDLPATIFASPGVPDETVAATRKGVVLKQRNLSAPRGVNAYMSLTETANV
ncbi:MAG: hypothetical protein JSS72_13260 [Armatimonadetes bacterium]|nr:hypothetical protein [Armatimonadota bacterium]